VLRQTPVALALVAAWGLCPSAASTRTSTPPAAPAAAVSPPTLPPLTNTVARTDRRVDEVPATVSVVPAADIETAGARDIKDLFRNQVDPTVCNAPRRFGLAGASSGRAGSEGSDIRGLEGNQVPFAHEPAHLALTASKRDTCSPPDVRRGRDAPPILDAPQHPRCATDLPVRSDGAVACRGCLVSGHCT
jgi:hypothetical protein